MTRMKSIYLMFDTFLAGIWGITIIDLLVLVNVGSFNLIDDWIKTLLALVGVLYLIFVKIPNEIRREKLNRRIKKAEAIQKELENKHTIEDHDK